VPEKPIVLVCGLPSSGNRVIARALKLAGADTWVCHGMPLLPLTHPARKKSERRSSEVFHEKHRPGQTFAVMPTRDLHHQVESYHRHHASGWMRHYPPDETIHRILSVVSHHKLPFRALSYEAFVQAPRQNLQYLAAWIGLPIKAWDLSFVHDGNEKYRDSLTG